MVSDHLKTQEMCNEAMNIEPDSLAYVPDRLKIQEMCYVSAHVSMLIEVCP